MSSSPKSHVHGDIGPIQNKRMGALEDCRIAICGAVGNRDRNARLDSLTVDDSVLGHCPSEAAIWAEQSHELFNSRWNQTEIVSELLLKILVLGQVVADSAKHQRRCNHADNQALSNASTDFVSIPPYTQPYGS